MLQSAVGAWCHGMALHGMRVTACSCTTRGVAGVAACSTASPALISPLCSMDQAVTSKTVGTVMGHLQQLATLPLINITSGSSSTYSSTSMGSHVSHPTSQCMLCTYPLPHTGHRPAATAATTPSHTRSFSTSPPAASPSPPPLSLGAPLPLPNRRVVITGLGLVTPLGVGVDRSWQALMSGSTAVKALTPEDLPEAHRKLLPQLACKVAALVPRDQLKAALAELGEDTRRTSPVMQYALLAAQEALRDAQWAPQEEKDRRATGVAIGSGMSSCSEVADAWILLESGMGRKVSPFFVPRILPNMSAGAVGIRLGVRGPNHGTSTACATGVHALGDAYRMVQRGDADVMVAGAAESCVDVISLTGFSRLRALSTAHTSNPSGASRPFDASRDGFVMGEGAGCVVMETAEHAAARGARVYAEVRGYGLSGDGHHITQPHPQGLGARLCMERAITGSGVPKPSIVYINAHATSTPQGDEVEQGAIASVFGIPPPEPTSAPPTHTGSSATSGPPAVALPPPGAWPYVSSTKGATGHLLGAAGAVECIFTILALHYSLAPPTANLERPEPLLLPGLVGRAAAPLPPGPKAALCNSFGFGGTNACLLLTTPQ